MTTSELLHWGETETDIFLMNKTRLMYSLGVYKAYARGLQSKSAAGQRVNLAALHSDLPIIPHLSPNLSDEIFPFFVSIVNTDTGSALPDTIHRVGLVDALPSIDTRQADIAVCSVAFPFDRPQVEGLAQFAIEMAEKGLYTSWR